MTHQFILCEDCDILWCISEYSQCPLCRLSKTFGHGMKGHWKDMATKTEAEKIPEQSRIEELTKQLLFVKENLLSEKEAHRQTTVWGKSNIEGLERTRIKLDMEVTRLTHELGIYKSMVESDRQDMNCYHCKNPAFCKIWVCQGCLNEINEIENLPKENKPCR